MSNDHAKRTIRGVLWNFLRVFGQTGLSIGVGVIYARLLPPSDFGLMAIALIFTGFADLVSSLGMGPAVIQRKDLSERHIITANSASILMGTVFALAVFLSAPWLSAFFSDDRVTDILRVIAISIWLSTASAVSRSLLMRKMDFRRLARIELTSYVSGYVVVGLTLAILGFGVWSLVFGTLCWTAMAAIWLYITIAPPLKFQIRKQEFKQLFGFGAGFSLNNMISYALVNADIVIIGRFLNPTLLGFYSRAQYLASMPLSRIAHTISSVMFSSYSEIQDDRPRLKRAYLKVVNTTSVLTFPVLTGLAISAEYFILTLLGDNWGEAIPVFRLLCIAGLFSTVLHLSGAVVQATGRIYSEVKRQLVKFVLVLAGLLYAVDYGIVAIATVQLLGSAFFYFLMAQLTLSILDCRWGQFFRAQIPGAMIALLVGAAQWLTIQAVAMGPALPAPVMLLLLILVSGLVLLLAMLFIRTNLTGEQTVWQWLRQHQLGPKALLNMGTWKQMLKLD